MLATRDPYFGVVPGNLLFLVALIVAWALFLRRSSVLVGYLRLGQPDARADRLAGRVGVVLRDVLGMTMPFMCSSARRASSHMGGTVDSTVFEPSRMLVYTRPERMRAR